ncbi:MAG: hypothetical protein ACYDBS_10650, partial [Acidimicrobiales bacterium]
AESAEDFVDEVLVGQLVARVVVVGRDFHFGRKRGGNVALLEQMGKERGFRVEPFDLVTDGAGGEVVSSTRIRGLVSEGNLEQAARLLGRPHEVRGLVISELSAFSGGGEVDKGVTVDVPTTILLPPPGGYEVRVGLVGAAGVPLQHCRVIVTPDRAVTVLGMKEAWKPGSPVRMLFEKGA